MQTGLIYYDGKSHGSSQAHAPLTVTRKGSRCVFISDTIKTGDRFRTPNWTAVDDALNSGSTDPKVWRKFYDIIVPVSYPCPAEGSYVKTTDAIKSSISQQVDIQVGGLVYNFRRHDQRECFSLFSLLFHIHN